MVDIHGLPLGLSVTTANINDREGSLQTISHYLDNMVLIENNLVDGGYSGKKYANSVSELMGACVEVSKRNEQHKFSVIPKRWIVERSFGWIVKSRRLCKNYERHLNNSLQFMALAFLYILIRKMSNL